MRIRVLHSGQVRLTDPVPKIVSILDMRVFEKIPAKEAAVHRPDVSGGVKKVSDDRHKLQQFRPTP
jgi:hypothetical protein